MRCIHFVREVVRIKNAPDPQLLAKRVQTPPEAFSLFISSEMLNEVVEYTNDLVKQFTAGHREVIGNSDKLIF